MTEVQRLRFALQQLGQASERMIKDFAEASPEVQREIRTNLARTSEAAFDVLHAEPTALPEGWTRYDVDPEALAWARDKVKWLIDKCRDFERQATENGTNPEQWRRFANLLDMQLLGGSGCVVTPFDDRKPELAPALAASQPYASGGQP